jgi:hypothetical protein
MSRVGDRVAVNFGRLGGSGLMAMSIAGRKGSGEGLTGIGPEGAGFVGSSSDSALTCTSSLLIEDKWKQRVILGAGLF